MTPPPVVRVLLSTYNSARHLDAQIESLLAQDYPALEILIRDDGSRDRTPEIVREYARRDNRIRFEAGENIGMLNSYFWLLRQPCEHVEFFAHCDHDDVWHADKVSHAVRALKQHEDGLPTMYCGRVRTVDDEGRPTGESPQPRRPLTFSNALVENVVFGCTMVIDRDAREVLLRTAHMNGVSYPDWWFYLTVTCFGRVIFDPVPHIDYRRHAGNTIGAPRGWRRFAQAWRIISKGAGKPLLRTQAQAIRANYGATMPADSLHTLERFLSKPSTWAARLREAFRCPVYRQRPLDDALLRLLLAVDRV